MRSNHPESSKHARSHFLKGGWTNKRLRILPKGCAFILPHPFVSVESRLLHFVPPTEDGGMTISCVVTLNAYDAIFTPLPHGGEDIVIQGRFKSFSRSGYSQFPRDRRKTLRVGQAPGFRVQPNEQVIQLVPRSVLPRIACRNFMTTKWRLADEERGHDSFCSECDGAKLCGSPSQRDREKKIAIYHAWNRGQWTLVIFPRQVDYEAFENILAEACVIPCRTFRISDPTIGIRAPIPTEDGGSNSALG